MRESFQKLVHEAKSVLVLLPKEPYFDSVAAGLSLYLALKESGREVVVSCPSEMIVEFNRLVGVDRITADVGNKNLEISFGDYRADDIERISSDVVGVTLSLKMIVKPGVKPPARDQVNVSYFGINADLVILVGGAHEKHFPALSGKDIHDTKFVHVGISEIKLPAEMGFISMARPGSSISEVVAELVKNENGFSADLASNLLMGIYEGSRSFSGKNVTAETFALASELMAVGGKIVSEEELSRKKFPVGAIPGAAGMILPPLGRPVMEKPEVESTAPKAWTQTPKIYKGTSIN